jgi:DNA-3-methyladenine glycosylase
MTRANAPALIDPPSSRPPLDRAFYERPVLAVARAMIGKVLVHRGPEGVTSGRVVEAEAYRGPRDLAAHSAGGRRTRRTEVMFGPPGHAYMFLLYGMHWAFNAVVGPEGHPHAVLVRAIEPLEGVAIMAARRGVDPASPTLTNGPGKLCAALGLDTRAYGLDLCGDVLYLTEGPRGKVGASARINVDYAGDWAHKPWRFYERGNRYVSVAPRA